MDTSWAFNGLKVMQAGTVQRGFFSALVALIGAFLLAPNRAIPQELPLPVDFGGHRAPAANAPPAPPPQQILRITLDDARHRALTSNKAMTLARMNIDGKQFATAAATKDYFPKALGSVTYFHFDNPLGSVLTTRGVLRPSQTVEANVLTQDSTLSTALVAQPITKLIAVSAAVQVSRADEQIAKAQLDQGAKQLLVGVTQVYYGLVGALRIQSALQLQGTVLEQAAAAHSSPELQIGLVQLRQGQLEVQSQVRDLSDQLNDLLDFPPGTVIELVDPVPPTPPISSADEAAQYALVCNPQVREASQNVSKAEAALKIARMDYYPDVNVIGGYANQTGMTYVQNNFTYLGLSANYTMFEWGKKGCVINQRNTDVAMAHQNMQMVADKVQLEARKNYNSYEQSLAAYRLAGDMVAACQAAERAAGNDPAAIANTKATTAKAQLEAMKSEITYRVAHAQLASAIGCQ